MEKKLQICRDALRRREIEVKTIYLCMNDYGDYNKVQLQGVELTKVTEFKCLKSTVENNGEHGQKV